MRRVPVGRERLAARARAVPLGVEQLLGLVAAHPVFEQLQVRRVVAHVGERHLVRAPGAFDLVAVDLLRPGPALRRAQHDHRPARPDRRCSTARAAFWMRADLADRLLQRRGHLLVHHRRIAALDEVRRVAVADEQRLQLLVADAREDRRVGDLVAVEVQDRQHRAVAHRVEELVRVPRRRERPGLGLAVADDAGDDQVGVVEAPCRRRARGCSRARRLRGSSPGVSGVTWLPMWPGKENCLKNFCIPSASSLLSG